MQDFRLAGQGQYVHHWQVCAYRRPRRMSVHRGRAEV